MCGSSTDITDVEKLVDGNLMDLIRTDPPYNVNYEGSNGLKIQNDSMSDDSFYQFLYDFYASAVVVTKPGGCIYVAHADSEGVNFRNAFKNA